jgi:hypothetical protein
LVAELILKQTIRSTPAARIVCGNYARYQQSPDAIPKQPIQKLLNRAAKGEFRV